MRPNKLAALWMSLKLDSMRENIITFDMLDRPQWAAVNITHKINRKLPGLCCRWVSVFFVPFSFFSPDAPKRSNHSSSAQPDILRENRARARNIK